MRKYVLILLLLVTLKFAASKRNFIFRGIKAECRQKQPSYLESFGCFIEQLGNRTYGTGHIMFQTPLKQLSTQMTVSAKPLKGRRSKLIDLRIDFCHIFAGLKSEKVFQLGTKILRRFMNEIPYCPPKIHFNYTLTRAYMDEEDFPVYTPKGDFQFYLGFYNQKEEIASFAYFGKILNA